METKGRIRKHAGRKRGRTQSSSKVPTAFVQSKAGKKLKDTKALDGAPFSDKKSEPPNPCLLPELLETDFSSVGSVYAIARKINSIGDILMNHYDMEIAGKSFRLIEIEAYLKCENHDDM